MNNNFVLIPFVLKDSALMKVLSTIFFMNHYNLHLHYKQQIMARFKENDLPKSKLPQVLSIKQLLYSNMQTITVGSLCRISFFIAYQSYGFGFP
jgi:hypothetical protein